MTGQADPSSDPGQAAPEARRSAAARIRPTGSASTALPLLPPDEQVLSTLNRDGTRRWLLPRVSPGRFLVWRRAVAYALIAIFAVLPFVYINGRPAILLNLAQREFTLLGFTFLPTDTVLLALFLLALIIGVFLLTALLGRIWCGWACPQSVYLEFVYRPLERLFDGTRGRGGRISANLPAWRRIAKVVAFSMISAYLANVFLAYFVGVEALSRWMRQSPLEHPAPFLVMAGATLLMLFDFGYFREQTCIVACPYGRLQSVLLDRQSLIISYDVKRGEPRGRLSEASAPRGDCIDCKLCVVTCPTGIDIRGGLQMECIGCAQCIDACDAVMQKIDRPRGLIRYSSQSAIAGEKSGLIRPRTVLYPALLLTIVAVLMTLFITKQSADVTLLRGLGRPFAELPDGTISNTLRVKLTNRTGTRAAYTFSIVSDAAVELRCDANPVEIDAGASLEVPLRLVAPRSAFAAGVHDVTVQVRDARDFAREMTYRLLGPQGAAVQEEAHTP